MSFGSGWGWFCFLNFYGGTPLETTISNTWRGWQHFRVGHVVCSSLILSRVLKAALKPKWLTCAHPSVLQKMLIFTILFSKRIFPLIFLLELKNPHVTRAWVTPHCRSSLLGRALSIHPLHHFLLAIPQPLHAVPPLNNFFLSI